MTTFQVEENQQVADALTEVIAHLATAYGPVEAAAEMRSAATPGNGFSTATVPWQVRPALALAMYQVAERHAMGDQLRGMADALSERPPHLR